MTVQNILGRKERTGITPRLLAISVSCQAESCTATSAAHVATILFDSPHPPRPLIAQCRAVPCVAFSGMRQTPF